MNPDPLIGKDIYFWHIIEQVERPAHLKTRGRYYKCQCKCGNIKIVYGASLKTGKSQSCGCLKKDKENVKNQQQKYGKLQIIEATDKRSNDGHIIYKCECECGNIHYATINNLKSGSVASCGCLYSKGEQEITNILTKNNIIYSKEYIFDDLVSKKGYPLRFDFCIYNEDKTISHLIEFQGEQHYEYSGSWFDNPKENDVLKINYCKKHNIPLIIIPYWKRNNLTIKDLTIEVIE